MVGLNRGDSSLRTPAWSEGTRRWLSPYSALPPSGCRLIGVTAMGVKSSECSGSVLGSPGVVGGVGLIVQLWSPA